jgi:hypothetical protein
MGSTKTTTWLQGKGVDVWYMERGWRSKAANRDE